MRENVRAEFFVVDKERKRSVGRQDRKTQAKRRIRDIVTAHIQEPGD